MDAGTLIEAKGKVSAISTRHHHLAVSLLVRQTVQYLKDAETYKSFRKKVEMIERADERLRYRISKVLDEISNQNDAT